MEEIIKKAIEGGYEIKKMEIKTMSHNTGEELKFTPDQPIALMVLDTLKCT